jgi:hypothetical protein
MKKNGLYFGFYGLQVGRRRPYQAKNRDKKERLTAISQDSIPKRQWLLPIQMSVPTYT